MGVVAVSDLPGEHGRFQASSTAQYGASAPLRANTTILSMPTHAQSSRVPLFPGSVCTQRALPTGAVFLAPFGPVDAASEDSFTIEALPGFIEWGYTPLAMTSMNYGRIFYRYDGETRLAPSVSRASYRCLTSATSPVQSARSMPLRSAPRWRR